MFREKVKMAAEYYVTPRHQYSTGTIIQVNIATGLVGFP
jgi:hypothetical protein